jgi:hypothetical protein
LPSIGKLTSKPFSLARLGTDTGLMTGDGSFRCLHALPLSSRNTDRRANLLGDLSETVMSGSGFRRGRRGLSLSSTCSRNPHRIAALALIYYGQASYGTMDGLSLTVIPVVVIWQAFGPFFACRINHAPHVSQILDHQIIFLCCNNIQ